VTDSSFVTILSLNKTRAIHDQRNNDKVTEYIQVAGSFCITLLLARFF